MAGGCNTGIADRESTGGFFGKDQERRVGVDSLERKQKENGK